MELKIVNKQWETKDLEDTQFHSSREERHIAGGILKQKGKDGFFQKNPAMKIILLDLIFIVIISGVIVPFIMKREGTARFENYSLTLKAFTFDNEVMAVLTVRGTKKSEPSGLIEVSFYFEDDLSDHLESDLPPSDGEKRVFRTKLISTGSEYIYCNIRINGKNKTIKGRIR